MTAYQTCFSPELRRLPLCILPRSLRPPAPSPACRLHYPTPGDGGQPLNASELYRHMAALSDWRQQHAAELPKLVWMDAPVQVGGPVCCALVGV